MNRDSLDKRDPGEYISEYSRDETDYETIRAIELNELFYNPETVGFNLTGDQIISPKRLQAIVDAQRLIDSLGEDSAFEELSRKYGKSPEEMHNVYDDAVAKELFKSDKLKASLEKMPDGISLRIHPAAPDSPFSMQNCRYTEDDEDAEYFSFDKTAIEEVKAVYDKVNAGEKPGDLTVVMNPYTKERGGNIPESHDEIESYVKMCLSFLSQMGLEEQGGAGICLEIGNETNIDKNTEISVGAHLFNVEGLADHVDPDKYAHFYTIVAGRIKERFPRTKVAIAGTAMFDDRYLERVISKVLEESGDNRSLIDKISFHPFREYVDDGAQTISENRCVDSELNYEQQLRRMGELASMADAYFDIGEISFSHARGESVDMAELLKNTENAKTHNIRTYIWPEWQIIEYE